ncbi:tRNA methyltransferase complex GCD14 subunit-domain-containing protein [Blastocladiella britannica]|nr:tRNA methyltransferase complex GCD14 subunit-domain-containing protein [Blastocladiella britannica]
MHSFELYTPAMVAGDIAIVFRGHGDMHPIVLTPGEVFNNKSGSFKHDDFIGKPWGSKFAGHQSKGHVTILHPTPELWTRSLPHRTQILYQADIAVITMKLRLRPGMVVVESGTGSGSFSHSLIRTVAPTGHVHTFEYHPVRANAAREEFIQHGLDHLVTQYHRDVCTDGFPDSVKGIADAVFLDLPAPWTAVASAGSTLRRDQAARICCFSPCIEQVSRTCDALRDYGFTGIEMVECLMREHDVRAVVRVSADDARRQVKPRKGKDAVERRRAGRPVTGDRRGPAGAPPSVVAAAAAAAASNNEDEEDIAAVATTGLAEDVSLRFRGFARGHTSFLTFATLLPLDDVETAAAMETDE